MGDQFGSGDNTRWGTHIDALSVGSALIAPLVHQVDPGYLYSGLTSQHRRITIRPAGGGGNVANVTVTAALACPHGTDVVKFTLSREGAQAISSAGTFLASKPAGAGGSPAAITLAGAFTPGRVGGAFSAGERLPGRGYCSATGITFGAGD